MALAIKGPRKTFKNLDDVLGFGTHRDDTIEHVLMHDLSYLKWMHNSTNNKLGKNLIKKIETLDEKYIGIFK